MKSVNLIIMTTGEREHKVHTVVMTTSTYLSWLLVGLGSGGNFGIMWSVGKHEGCITWSENCEGEVMWLSNAWGNDLLADDDSGDITRSWGVGPTADNTVSFVPLLLSRSGGSVEFMYCNIFSATSLQSSVDNVPVTKPSWIPCKRSTSVYNRVVFNRLLSIVGFSEF